MKLKSVALACVLVAAAGCGAAGEEDMVLTDEGYIKVAGGCVAYMTAEIKFAPRAGGAVRVVVDNSGGWFEGEGSEPFRGCDATLSAGDAAAFFSGLHDVLDHPKKLEHGPSTYMGVVEIYLPFEGGTLETTWREADGTYDIGPLLRFLRESVRGFSRL